MSKDSERGKYASPEGSNFWEFVAAISCSMMVFCVGNIAGWTSPTLGILMGPDAPNPLTASEASTLSSIVALGHTLAPGLVTIMVDKLGRKNSLLVAGIPTVIHWGMIAVSNHLMVLLVARFIGGISLGLIFCLPSIYLGEIASAKLRGAIGMLCGTMLNAGALLIFVLGPYFSVKMMACLSLVIAIVSVISVWFIPESPYSLAMKGKFDKAEESLEKLRGKTDVGEELEMVKMTVSKKAKGHKEGKEGHEALREPSAFRQLLTVSGNRRAFGIVLLFTTSLQLGSYLVIMIYGEIVFGKIKSGISAHICIVIVAVLQLISNLLTVFVIDKFGRRPLICLSGVASGLCALIVAVYFYLMEYTETDVTPYGTFAACTIFLKMIVINIGLLPMQPVIQSEVLDLRVKGLAICIVQVLGGVMATLSVKIYLMIAEAWGFGHSIPFFGFAANAWICTLLILKMLPETKGKTLLEIQRDLNA